MEISALKNMATQVRRDIVRMVYDAQSGHPGGSLGCTEFMVALYFEVMKHNPKFQMDGKDEDLFFLSNGHISPLLYSVLARNDYFPIKELSTFRKINSRLQGHPTTHEGLPGIRVATGSLGQGLSVAIGAALAKKLNHDSRWVYSLHGDGELEEGQNWEAFMFAAHHKVDNLIATIDYNGQQIDGPTNLVMSLGDLKLKLLAFGWDVLELEEGNDLEKVIQILREAQTHTGKGKPVVILLHTEMGHGVSYMAGTHKWHGKAPNEELFEQAMAELTMAEANDY